VSDHIRVLIADDSFIVRGGLRRAVESFGGFSVVGEAATGQEAYDRARTLAPHILLMDLRMPNEDGIAATQRIRQGLPEVRTIIVSWSDEPDDVRDAIYAGARGYLVHGRFDPAELRSAMEAVAADDVSMTPIIARGILAASERGEPATRLTSRELEILRLVQRGRRNRDIAGALGLEEKTVKNHINSIYSKLGISSRAEAMAVRPDLEA